MRARRGLWLLAVVALVAVGVLQRIWILQGRWGAIDSDEAVVGLMARSFLDGHWRAFYWGQDYAGSLEPGLVALFGASVGALKVVPAALSALCCILVWRVGRRCFDERLAQAAGLLFWVAPGAYVWWSTKERGFYWSSMALGLVLLLAALRIVQENRWPLDGALLGFVAGLGLWISPTVLYFAVPAGVWVLARHSPPLRWLVTAVPAALVGALPWLWHNVGHGFPSLTRPPQPQTVSYLGAISRLGRKALPIALNLRYPISYRWWSGSVGTALYVALLLALVVAFVVRRDRPLLVLAALAAFPFIYAWFPGAWFVGEGRYALFAAPFLALAIAWLVRRPFPAVALCALAAIVSVGMIRAINPEPPDSITGDLATLRHAGITRVWGAYWVAYRLGFESGGWLVASPYGAERDEGPHEAVLAARRPAFLYRRGDPRARSLVAALGRGARLVHTPHFVVVLADRHIDPAGLPAGLMP